MSANPLLDALRASIPEGGKLTLDALNSFINNAMLVDPAVLEKMKVRPVGEAEGKTETT